MAKKVVRRFVKRQPPLSPGNVAVGHGVTVCHPSDRYAATVVWVSNTGKTIRITMDEARLIEGGMYSEKQVYEYKSVPEKTLTRPDGTSQSLNTRTARWSEKQTAFVLAGTRTRLACGRHTYRDPHI